ncbi:isoflavone reductase family protein [Talaromyces stipitatus ATCC 10500]|uniref:Isoflavone reductase family protein n=1 Tax=Talaromyces stipitatus (strain ATCC 10500 / CBS 375.48 / QM 6759 / NRRL 1006) TaxID=441959 RepID=B8M1W2_TALSN|nr:isoflavone reductase family protein [Talaromyces stipitatus ATCC 10500]EED21340.1 isoflavone reductase family protein [Talaromyces stipitatus ATCC 10500]
MQQRLGSGREGLPVLHTPPFPAILLLPLKTKFKMVKVAIAGGSSPTLGESLVSALLSTNGRHTPIILSRQSDNTRISSNVEIRQVDYTSHTSLVNALRDIDVVISVLLIPGPEFITYQINLLHAAEEAGCRRFAPSEFALSSEAHEKVDILSAKLTTWDAVRSSVERGKIDAARFPCGMFMNYLGIGCPPSKRKDALAGFSEGPYLFHLEGDNPWVEVPLKEDDGQFSSLIMTNIRDIGKFITAAIDLEEPWSGRELGMAGETINFRDAIAICEQYIGKKIEVRPVTKAQLSEKLQEVPKNNFIEYMECQLSIAGTEELFLFEATLNKLCPQVRPMTITEFMQTFWTGL